MEPLAAPARSLKSLARFIAFLLRRGDRCTRACACYMPSAMAVRASLPVHYHEPNRSEYCARPFAPRGPVGHLIGNTQRNSSRRAKPARTVPPHKTTPVENTMGNRLTDTWLRLTPCQKAQSGQRHGPNLVQLVALSPAAECLGDEGPEFAP